MDKRLGFVMVLSASALVWVGCDDPPPADGGVPCGGDSGTICIDDDAGVDAGEEDAGPEPDAGPISDMCQVTGGSGGRCRGTMCSGDLTCFPDTAALEPGLGGPVTVEALFGIPPAVEDPANPGEYLTEGDHDFEDIPIRFAPGGQCSEACALGSDTCGPCSACSTSLGGSAAFAAIGITVSTLDLTDPDNDGIDDSLTTEAMPGICRAQCDYDPAERGCQAGYSCDSGEDVCLEECVTDAQCNLGWAVTRHEGLVSIVDGAATCDTTLGRCTWTPPAGAAFGSACESNTDCPADVGFCAIGGRCLTTRCNPDAGGLVVACGEGGICGTAGADDPGTCYPTCESPDDCFPGNACTSALFSGASPPSICIGICTQNSECHADERCDIGGFQNPDFGTCQPFCDPAGGTAGGAVECAADERCVQVAEQTYGFCEPTDTLCGADQDCLDGQACEFLNDDALGQCVDGCTVDTECATGQECVIQPGGEACTAENAADVCNSGVCTAGACAPSTYGVCRAAGGACAASPDVNEDGQADIPLRGDPQCIESQHCDSTSAEVVGACVDDVTP